MKRIVVICCGVLEWRFRSAAERSPNEVHIARLPAGLHADPTRLRSDLQAAIDLAEGEHHPDAIVLGYGVCGRGVVRVAAREAPLAIVRAEDCIAILLGSQQRYREEFLRYPGTFYFSHGWVHSRGQGAFNTERNRSLYKADEKDLAARFGVEEAAFIRRFRESWKGNYERAAYVGFADDPDAEALRERTAAFASDLGWVYEELKGDDALFQALVDGRWDHPAILVVSPGEIIIQSPGVESLAAGRDLDASFREVLRRFHEAREVARPPRQGLGLGIDAGGTYTDSVIYDFDARRLLSKSKAPTTHEDLVVGVRESLAGLDAGLLPRVSRAALSTTLATNAIVEGKGRPVGLLLMGIRPQDLERFQFAHKRLIPGRMSMEGRELVPLDPEATARAAEALRDEGAEAFAVSGYAAVVDSRHEVAVAEFAHEATGLPVVCGHELSRSLNLFNRGVTAALNARLIPLVQGLIASVRRTLAELGLRDVPLRVVCGDGGQMLDRYAEMFPVEQILSGPAASVIGALELVGQRDAIVADMGGTTLDVAVIHDGEPALDLEGARVGDFQTCVRAMRIHTVGLGCDSEIRLENWPDVRVGPRRVLPIAVLADRRDSVMEQLRALAGGGLETVSGIEPTDFLTLGPRAGDARASGAEAAVLRALADGPLLLTELAKRVGAPSASLLPVPRLERMGAVFRAGVTPTDLLHLEGRYTRFRGAAATLAFDLLSEWLGVPASELCDAIRLTLSRTICREILAADFADEEDWDPAEGSAGFVVDRLFRDDEGATRIRVALGKPVTPIGAPVHAFFPQLAEPLGTEIMMPDHAEVANAVGAIAGDIVLSEQVDIVAASDGAFHLQSRMASRRLFEFAEAVAMAEQWVREALATKARLNGIEAGEPEFQVRESVPDSPLGPIFLGVTLTGRVRA